MNEYMDRIKTYADLAKMCGSMILCNAEAERPLELVSGEWEDGDEVMQWYLVQDADFLMEHTDELVFFDEELGLHVWGITHWGTSWDYVSAPDLH